MLNSTGKLIVYLWIIYVTMLNSTGKLIVYLCMIYVTMFKSTGMLIVYLSTYSISSMSLSMNDQSKSDDEFF